MNKGKMALYVVLALVLVLAFVVQMIDVKRPEHSQRIPSQAEEFATPARSTAAPETQRAEPESNDGPAIDWLPPNAKEECTGDLRAFEFLGRILNENGNPIGEFHLELNSGSGKKGYRSLLQRDYHSKDGRFLVRSFLPLDDWDLTLTFSAPGRVSRQVHLIPSRDGWRHDCGDLILQRAYRLTGHLQDDAFTPIVGVRLGAVHGELNDGESLISAMIARSMRPPDVQFWNTGADGEFELDLREGTWTFAILENPSLKLIGGRRVDVPYAGDLLLVAHRMSSLGGTVTNEAGEPIDVQLHAFCRVQEQRIDLGKVECWQGRFQIFLKDETRIACPVYLELPASSPYFLRQRGPFIWGQSDLRIVLEQQRFLEAFVFLERRDHPVENCRISLAERPDLRRWQKPMALGGGRFRLPHPGAGRFYLSILPSSKAVQPSPAREIICSALENPSETFFLEGARFLVVHVSSATGTPVEHAKVAILANYSGREEEHAQMPYSGIPLPMSFDESRLFQNDRELTDAAGMARLRLPPERFGPALLIVSHEGFGMRSLEIPPKDEREDLRITLAAGLRLRLVIRPNNLAGLIEFLQVHEQLPGGGVQVLPGAGDYFSLSSGNEVEFWCTPDRRLELIVFFKNGDRRVCQIHVGNSSYELTPVEISDYNPGSLQVHAIGVLPEDMGEASQLQVCLNYAGNKRIVSTMKRGLKDFSALCPGTYSCCLLLGEKEVSEHVEVEIEPGAACTLRLELRR